MSHEFAGQLKELRDVFAAAYCIPEVSSVEVIRQIVTDELDRRAKPAPISVLSKDEHSKLTQHSHLVPGWLKSEDCLVSKAILMQSLDDYIAKHQSDGDTDETEE